MFFFYFVTGCKNKETGLLLKECFHTDYFRIVVVEDNQTVEICGALKVSVRNNIAFVYKETYKCYRHRKKLIYRLEKLLLQS